MSRPLEVWFEFASTYSYPACSRVARLATDQAVPVVWKPFLLGPIFGAQGWETSPFNLYEAKGRYMWRDMERLCAAEGLPFARPAVFPRNTVAAARIACLGEAEPWLPAYVAAVYRANFAEGRDIADPAVLEDILAGLGLDAPAILDAAEGADNRPRLRANTDEAMARGVFGAPTFFVGDEMFWGSDRLDQALAWARAGAPDPV